MTADVGRDRRVDRGPDKTDRGAALGTGWAMMAAHRADLLRMSVRLMNGNIADAEDALGQVTMKVIRALPQQSELRDEGAWLRRILKNVCTDMHRQQGRRGAVLEPHTAELLVDLRPGPEPTVLFEELSAVLSEVVTNLSDALREPLMMRIVGEMAYDEIAAELGITNANTRKRVQLARDQIRQALRALAMGPD